MKKGRLGDDFEFNETQKRGRKRNRLIIFPLLSISLAVVTLIPVLTAYNNGRTPTLLMLIPVVFGAFLLYRGLGSLIENRKEIAAFFSKKDDETTG